MARYVAALRREGNLPATWVDLPENTAEAVEAYLTEYPDPRVRRVMVGTAIEGLYLTAVDVLTVKSYDVMHDAVKVTTA